MCWPRANAGASNITGILRSTPDDFEVTETLTFEPEGEGEHLYVLAEKRGVTTRAVQQMLASRCGVPVRDVSYAGMKDKYAVARQWFSVRRPQREDIHIGESLQPRECEGVPRKIERARGHPSHEKSLQPRECEGVPRKIERARGNPSHEKSLQPRECEGVPRKKERASGNPSHENTLQPREREGIPRNRAHASGNPPHENTLQPQEREGNPRNRARATDHPSQTGVRILRRDRHRRKLRRGELKHNHFRIRIRALAGDPETSFARLRAVGAPNYFGAQRFGATGDNVAAALDWVRAGKPRISPFLRSVYLSSMRSFLFNEVLAERVADGTWRCLLDGEAELCGAPTGPLWGRGRPAGAGAARALEERALRAHGEIARALEFVGLRQQRRPLAAIPRELSWRVENGALTVEFALDRGTYATSVLREIGAFRDAERALGAADHNRDAAG